MLQGQEKSYSIVDNNLPYSSFLCHPLPGEGRQKYFWRNPRRSLLPYSVPAGPSPTPSEHPEIAAGHIAQMVEEW